MFGLSAEKSPVDPRVAQIASKSSVDVSLGVSC